MDTLAVIGRSKPLFEDDLKQINEELSKEIERSSFLVIGGAGSIGQAVVLEIFKRNPQALHVVDISENNLVELVRDIRSSFGYMKGDFKTFSIDAASKEFELVLLDHGPYDYVLNLSAMKHVRSERDPYTLMRLIEVNILSVIRTVKLLENTGVKKYFCVSTDKAANPVSMMGASKRIMEMCLMREGNSVPISMARFANVAFSDGSVLHGYDSRIAKNQPFSAPYDVKRYFITKSEAGELCLISALLGEDRDILFPKLSESLRLMSFPEVTESYLDQRGYRMHRCESEEEARQNAKEIIETGAWPCSFFKSDTDGEKDFEEFYTEFDDLDLERFSSIGVIRNPANQTLSMLDQFLASIEDISKGNVRDKDVLLELFGNVIPEFSHIVKGKSLDNRM